MKSVSISLDNECENILSSFKKGEHSGYIRTAIKEKYKRDCSKKKKKNHVSK